MNEIDTNVIRKELRSLVQYTTDVTNMITRLHLIGAISTTQREQIMRHPTDDRCLRVYEFLLTKETQRFQNAMTYLNQTGNEELTKRLSKIKHTYTCVNCMDVNTRFLSLNRAEQQEQNSSDKIEATKLHRDGEICYALGNYKAAKNSFELAYNRRKVKLGLEHLGTLNSWVWLGIVSHALGKYEEALSIYGRLE